MNSNSLTSKQHRDANRTSLKDNNADIDRTELAEQQRQLVNALLGLAPAPPEVDADQVRVCGQSLRRKRARTLERFLGEPAPDTARSIIPEMDDYFERYPGVHRDGPHADFKQYQKFVSSNIIHQLVEQIRTRFTKFR
ncbi:MAG: hypothetical protein SGJ27_10880 [Candidatus Melainabacteria bacterium]|nr:hypothetical protein [Candidatus Melainabacteria bacterium]